MLSSDGTELLSVRAKCQLPKRGNQNAGTPSLDFVIHIKFHTRIQKKAERTGEYLCDRE